MPFSGPIFSIINTFVADTKILASAVNANFADIASGLSAVLKRNGDSTMTGQFKASGGSAAAPGMTFGADLDTGFYRPAANAIQAALGGVAGAKFLGAGITMGYRSVSANDTIAGTDNGGIVEVTANDVTLAFTAAATLGDGFWCIIHNSGTGDVTLDPDSSELIDGLASWVLYPGGAALVRCTGSAFESMLLAPMRKQFDASGTFTTPGAGSFCLVEAWGGGGSGGKGGAANDGGGGGGGAYNSRRLLLSALGATETVTIGAGGAAVTADNTDGNVGGNTTFGAHVSAFGGGGGSGDQGGGGGGGSYADAGDTSSNDDGGNAGTRLVALAEDGSAVAAHFGQGATASGISGGDNIYGGGGGSGSATNAGNGGWGHYGGGGGGGGSGTGTAGVGGSSVYGGAGGGGGSASGTAGSGGTSQCGGNGGAGATGAAAATAGSAPGGGGGGSEEGTSGAGADGRVIVTVW